MKKRRYIKLMAPEGVHIPNKNEAALLRKIMSKSGLTEKEVREHKTYRILLSQIQKEGTIAKLSAREKAHRRIMKTVTIRLKLAKEHPLVVIAFKPLWEEHCRYKYYY